MQDHNVRWKTQRSGVFSCILALLLALLVTLLTVTCDNTKPIPVLPTPTATSIAIQSATPRPIEVTLPDFTQASSLVIEDGWSGYGGLDGVGARYDLEREAEGFIGKATFTVRGEPFDIQEVVTDVVIPDDITRQFLSMIQTSHAQEGTYNYATVLSCCDDYPMLSIELQVAEGKVRFYSPSKEVNGRRCGSIFTGGHRIPWAVDSAGKIHVVNSARPAEACAILDAYLRKEVLEDLIKEIGENPEGRIPACNSKS